MCERERTMRELSAIRDKKTAARRRRWGLGFSSKLLQALKYDVVERFLQGFSRSQPSRIAPIDRVPPAWMVPRARRGDPGLSSEPVRRSTLSVVSLTNRLLIMFTGNSQPTSPPVSQALMHEGNRLNENVCMSKVISGTFDGRFSKSTPNRTIS